MDKFDRQRLIKELVQTTALTNQAELLTALAAAGVTVTQTTVSRDLRALNITRVRQANGRMVYQCIDDTAYLAPTAQTVAQDDASIAQAITTYAIWIQVVQFMIVIRTQATSGNILAGQLDESHDPAIIATLAGFDTIYVTCRDQQAATQLAEQWRAWLVTNQ